MTPSRRQAGPAPTGAAVLLAVMVFHSPTIRGAENELTGADLASLDIEELMKIRVTSVARKPESLEDSAAAIQVLTREDIRRSGALTLPELFRLIPGINVAQANGSSWAIGARGFSSVFASKMLVLVDGRSVYSPLNAGVFWDSQDMLLADIERIEVIRGPGASVWGANAVNGVINIITKSAYDTTGVLVAGGGGTEERAFGWARYGADLGESASYRVWGKYLLRDETATPAGSGAGDDFRSLRGGLRLDWELSLADELEIQGELFATRWGEHVQVPALAPPYISDVATRNGGAGGYVRARWSHQVSARSEWALQAYYDQMRRHIPEVVGNQVLQVVDVDFQHRFDWGERQAVVWGAGYRLYHDDTGGLFLLSFRPVRRTQHLFSAFVQDEIVIVAERLRLTVGSKFEHNDSTGFEIAPSARVLWTPGEGHTLWTAFSRAVRTPSRAEDDFVFNTVVDLPPVANVRFFGNRDLRSEVLWASEAGYRARVTDVLHVDLAAFYNRYDHLRSWKFGVPDATVSPMLVPATIDDQIAARTYGGELAVLWTPLSSWHVQAAYTLLQMDLFNARADAMPAGIEDTSGSAPAHQALFRSLLELPGHFELDCTVRGIGPLKAFTPVIEGYWEADLRIGWRRGGFEMTAIGRNLLREQHREFGAPNFPPIGNAIERSLYLLLAWRS